MKPTFFTLVLALVSTAVFAADPSTAPDDKTAFAQLKKLAGTWRGKADCKGMERFTVEYRVIAGGSTLMETFNPGTKMEMVSMYHLDKDGELVMRHYCVAGNQPKVEYDRKHSAANTLAFEFDGGDVNTRHGMHMHNGKLTFVGKNKIESEWIGWMDGKPQPASRATLTRVSQ